MTVLTMLTEEQMETCIRNAKRRVVYIAPGIWLSTAEAITEYLRDNPYSVLDIILDPDPQVYRLGYGNIAGIKHLTDIDVPLRKCTGIRIGLFIADDEAWYFTPTPRLIEKEPTSKSVFAPNSIIISIDHANHLLGSAAPQSDVIEAVDELIEEKHKANETVDSDLLMTEIANEHFSSEDIQAIEDSLEECPPQQFDLARRVSVYSSYVQFVELSLEGTHLERHTIAIPQELLNLTPDDQDQERLKASYRLITSDGDVSSKTIHERIKKLRERYLRSLGYGYGTVILKQHKNDFIKDIDELKEELGKYKSDVKKKLKDEFYKCKINLIEILRPIVENNPPAELKYGINASRIEESMVVRYLEEKLEKVIPKADTFVTDMNIRLQFKEVTYEMLHDETFIENLQKAYPYANLPKVPIDEVTAVTSH